MITGFLGVHGEGNYWTFSGTVTDVDDSVQGMNVTFGGVLTGYGWSAAVQSDGSFSLGAEFVGLQSGSATAQTQDWAHMWSNLAVYEVLV